MASKEKNPEGKAIWSLRPEPKPIATPECGTPVKGLPTAEVNEHVETFDTEMKPDQPVSNQEQTAVLQDEKPDALMEEAPASVERH